MTDILGPLSDAYAVTSRPNDLRTAGNFDTWFSDCTSQTAGDGTDVSAAFLNTVAGVLRALVRGNGVTAALGNKIVAEDNSDGMVLTAIQHLQQRGIALRCSDTGGQNALVAGIAPVPPELVDGMRLRIRSAFVNNGPATLTVGTFQRPVVLPGNVALTGNEIQKVWQDYTYDATLTAPGAQASGVWQLTALAQAASAVVGFPKIVRIASTQNYTPSAGTRRIAVLPTGPGGPGGSGNGGCGGGGGESVLALFDVSALSLPVLCVVGAASAPSASNATAGSTASLGTPTTFGPYVTANPGQSGYNNCAYGTGALGGTGGATAGQISFPGSPGEGASGTQNASAYGYRGGSGGRSLRSGGGVGVDGDNPGRASVTSNGGNAPGPGGGGGGCDPGNGGSPAVGGLAGNGEILIWEMA